MTLPGARGSTLLDYSTLLENYTPVLGGTWFQSGMTANSGQAFAYWNDQGYVGLAIATRDGISAYPADGVTIGQDQVEVDANGWLLVGPLSNSPIQLRQDTTVDTGHIDSYDLAIAYLAIQWVGTLSGQFDITFDTGSYTATITDAMDEAAMQTAIQDALIATGNSGQVRVKHPDGVSIIITGPVGTILTGGPGGTGIANDSTDGNAPTVTVEYHAYGFPAPFASTFHVMGSLLSEAHLFLRDGNAASDPYFPYLQGWDEVSVTRFISEVDYGDVTFAIAQGPTTIVVAKATIFGDFQRMGLLFGRLRFRVTLTITGVTDGSASAFFIDCSNLMGRLLPFSYINANDGEIVGHYTAFLANGDGMGHLMASGFNTSVYLQDPANTNAPSVLSTELSVDDVLYLDFDFLISND